MVPPRATSPICEHLMDKLIPLWTFWAGDISPIGFLYLLPGMLLLYGLRVAVRPPVFVQIKLMIIT